MKNKRVRLVVEFDINSEACKESGVTEREVLNGIMISESDVIDGFEIYSVHPQLDMTSDFVLGGICNITSAEFVDNVNEEN